MVGIAQLVRVPGCGPGGRGFEPHYSPHFTDSAYYGVSPSGKAPDFDSGTRRFKSCHPSHFCDPLAQLVEHLTFNQVVRSSTLRRITIFFFCRCGSVCGCGGIGRRARFRFWCPKGVWVQVSSPAPKPFCRITMLYLREQLIWQSAAF